MRKTRAGLVSKALGILSILVLLVLALPGSVAGVTDDSKPVTAPAPEGQVKEVRRVTLVTGDAVTVTIMTDGKRSFAISPAAPNRLGQRFFTIEQNGDTYILPDSIDLGKMDMELFNIDYLVDEHYDKEPGLPLLVSYLPGLSVTAVQSLEGKVRALSQETKPLNSVSAVATRLAYGNIATAYQSLVSQPEISKIWLNRKVHAQLAESVPLIGAPSWWQAGYNGRGTKIAILDTGIDSTHPALDDLDDSANTTDPKVIVNVNFTDDANFNDLFGHGTHVAGIAAGTTATGATAATELATIQGAVVSMMVDNGLSSLPTGYWVTTPTSNMTLFPAPNVPIGSGAGQKYKDPTGTAYYGSDKIGYVLYGHDITANGENTTLVNYLVTPTTKGTYVILDASGTVNQTLAPADGFPGVAPGAWLWNVKVLNQYGSGYWEWVINGINFASLGPDGVPRTGDEADIISMSLGGSPTDGTDPVSQAVNLAVERGVTVVVAAGNSGSGSSTISNPGVAEKVITVGASAKDDTLAYFSSRGPTMDMRIKPDILAPGVDITSSVTTNPAAVINAPSGYGSLSGTSMATPHVAGAAALLLQAMRANEGGPPAGLTVPQFIKDALISPAKDLGYNVYEQGGGRLDLTYWTRGINTLVSPASLSLGIFGSGNATATGNLTFIPGASSHNITLSAQLTDVYSSGNYSSSVTLNPASFTLPARTHLNVGLSVNLTALPKSLFSGKVIATVDNTTAIHAIFGFARANRVTVHKTNITGAPAQGHPVWVFMSSPRDEMFISYRMTDASGNLTFYAPDGIYQVLSPNWYNEINQTTIWTIAENVTVSGDTTINLDERDTRAIDFSPNKPGLIPSAKASILSYRPAAPPAPSPPPMGYGWSASWWYPQSFLTRVSPTSRFDAAFAYNAYPEADFMKYGSGLVNTGEWYNLLYPVDNITDNITFVADYPNLVHRWTGYGVALNGEKAYWSQSSWAPTSPWTIGFSYNMDAPQVRWEWLSPSPVQYSHEYRRALSEPGNRWSFRGWSSYSPGENGLTIGFHPLTSGVNIGIWNWSEGVNRLYIWGPISRDPSNNTFVNQGTSLSGHLKVTNNSDNTVFERDIGDEFQEWTDLTGTDNFTVEIGSGTPLALSSTAYTRLDFTANSTRDSSPPRLSFWVPGINAFGIVPGGRVLVRVGVDESINSVHLSYSLGDSTNWTDADLPTFDSGDFVFNLGPLQETMVNIAVSAADQYGNRILRRTNRAFYVGAPGAEVRVNAPPAVIPSSNFTATIDVSNVTNLDAANYDVTFDPAVLSLINVTSGNVSGTVIPVGEGEWNLRSPGRYTIVQNVPGLSGVSGSGYLAVLRFQVLGTFGTSSNITLGNGMLSDNQYQAIPAAWIGARVSVTARAGDATGDGLIDSRDITKVERIIARLDPPTVGADANLDGNINSIDITRVERLIVGLN